MVKHRLGNNPIDIGAFSNYFKCPYINVHYKHGSINIPELNAVKWVYYKKVSSFNIIIFYIFENTANVFYQLMNLQACLYL